MARQPRTSKRSYVQEKDAIKCASCGIPSNDCSIKYIRGIARWVCAYCKEQIEKKNKRNGV